MSKLCPGSPIETFSRGLNKMLLIQPINRCRAPYCLSISTEHTSMWIWEQSQQPLLLLHVERSSARGSLSYFKEPGKKAFLMNNYATQSSVQGCNDTHRQKIVISHPSHVVWQQLYRVIKKSLCTWWLQYRNLQVMFNVSPASLQIFIDTPNCVLEDRVQYSTVHIPNVFCDGHLHIISCVGNVRICWVQVHRDFLIILFPRI
jgi:hypothetical protein